MKKKLEDITLEPRLLDCQIVDSEGKRCGKVDNVLFEQRPKGAIIKSLLVGFDTWHEGESGIIRWIFSHIIFSKEVIEIPWEYVEEIFPLVKLKVKGSELGLRLIDERLGKIIRRIPGG